MPKISCIMPVYNTVDYLEECIESILNQSFTDFEFIISDDGSTDWSKEIIRKYTEQDKRIIFLDNKKNRWICANLNDMVNLASWEYIAIMESDDISYKERFKVQLNEFSKDIDLIGWSAEYIDKEWNTIISRINWIESNNEMKNTFFKKIWIITPSFIIRKNSLIKNWYFKYSEIWDYELYVKIILKEMKIKNIKKILIKKRIHNESSFNKKGIQINNILFQFKKDIIKEYKLPYTSHIIVLYTYIIVFIISSIKKVLQQFEFYNYIYKKFR